MQDYTDVESGQQVAIPKFVRREMSDAFSSLFVMKPGVLEDLEYGLLTHVNSTTHGNKRMRRGAARLCGSLEQARNQAYALRVSSKIGRDPKLSIFPTTPNQYGPIELVQIDD